MIPLLPTNSLIVPVVSFCYWGEICLNSDSFNSCAVKYVAKLEDGTMFEKKGQDEEELFQFTTDEGTRKTIEFCQLNKRPVRHFRVQCSSFPVSQRKFVSSYLQGK